MSVGQRLWSAAELRFLIRDYPQRPTAEVAARLGRSLRCVYRRAERLGLRKPPEYFWEIGLPRNRTRHPWTPQDVAILRNRYPHERTADVAAAVGHPLKSVYAKASSLGLHKSEAFKQLPISGRWSPGSRPGWATRFQPGHATWNKGISYHAGGRSAETQFKPGAYPAARWDQDAYGLGALRITTDGCLLINIGGTGRQAWAMLSRYVWWRETGRWPRRDEVVRAINGDPYDTRFENLELLTRRQNMLRNSVHNLPPEVAKLVQLRGQLVRRIREREERAA